MDRQLDGLLLDKVFADKLSGKDAQRPAFQQCMQFLREGDTLVVHSMDRLARNLDDLRRTVQTLTGRGVRVQFVKEGLLFSGDDSPMANLRCRFWAPSPSLNGRLFGSANWKVLRLRKGRVFTRAARRRRRRFGS